MALDAGGGTSATDSSARNYVPEYAEETEAIQKSLKIRLVQGGLNTKSFRDYLDELEIPYDYEQLPGDVEDYPEGSSCLNKKDPAQKVPAQSLLHDRGPVGRKYVGLHRRKHTALSSRHRPCAVTLLRTARFSSGRLLPCCGDAAVCRDS